MKKKIGWQKYEDLLEKQMSSPMLQTIIKQMITYSEEAEAEVEEEEEYEKELYTGVAGNTQLPLLPISQQLMDDMAMLSNFDCWIAHTNFDITRDIKNKLNKIEGVELLKICSRYRFFIGIGQMFDFKQVRKNVELGIIPKGD
jgi:hypothetical protein